MVLLVPFTLRQKIAVLLTQPYAISARSADDAALYNRNISPMICRRVFAVFH